MSKHISKIAILAIIVILAFTLTPLFTTSAQGTPGATPDYSSSPSATVTATATRTHPPGPSFTASPTKTATPTVSPTKTTTTPTTTPTVTVTVTVSPTSTPTVTVTGTPKVTPTVTVTVTPTVTATSTVTATPTAAPTVTVTATPKVTVTATPTITPTVTVTATPTVTVTVTPTTTPTKTPSPTAVAGSIAPSPNPSDKSSDFEIRYIKVMMNNHAMVVAMTELMNHAGNESFKMLAEYLNQTQTADITMMQTWLSDWYDISYTPNTNQGLWQDELEVLSGLNGDAFEQEFLSFLMAHLGGSVKTSVAAVEFSFHKQLIEHAELDILTSGCMLDSLRGTLNDRFNITSFAPNSQLAQFEREMLDYLISGSAGGSLFTPPNG